ncbi:ABC transporter ATP-binding protein [Candidatus Stoquefichus massiliensis]|uniref:ABC transporter ATP-binding protein n=1 Tax=Candidatus Stoquefichus massiliensis TaxID=1470350 RepID=UPI00048244ED|nr:ABC transporter ATP-binding protein [Candidatus Stoquefichus massiliensis]
MKKILEISQLTKSFDKNCAVNHIDFSIYEGEILCLLGPNGAGKSTTIHMLSGIMKKDTGTIAFMQQDIQSHLRQYQQALGFVPQDIALYEDLTAWQNIHFFASLYGLKGEVLNQAVYDAITFAGLMDRKYDKVKTFSGGMKRRLNIACAIAHHPKFVIMDEPTVGIDPQSRNHILSSIKQLQAEGMTVLYTTHYMEEVEEISDRIIIMDHGEIIAEGTKEQLKANIAKECQYIIHIDHIENLDLDEFYKIAGIQKVMQDKNELQVTTLKDIENLNSIIEELMRQKQHIQKLTTNETNLETVFLKLTGRRLRDSI